MKHKIKAFVLVALVVSFLLAIFISPFASPNPDGLERVAEDKGFIELAEERVAWQSSPIPDYLFPGIGSESVATGVAGMIGVVITFGAAYFVAIILKGREG